MEKKLERGAVQGLWNVIRFNWHFYVISFVVIGLCIAVSAMVGSPYDWVAGALALLVICMTMSSLVATFYVYDMSRLYDLDWLDEAEPGQDEVILNVSAGFDETSALLNARYRSATLHVMDFYHSLGQKEISIQRAKKAYPLASDATEINLAEIPLPDHSVDRVFAIFAAHEIRNEADRIGFFKELARVTRDNGRVYVVEHLRDLPNFIAYNIGFFHFLPRVVWLDTFEASGWHLSKTVRHTPFVSVFILEKSHGVTS